MGIRNAQCALFETMGRDLSPSENLDDSITASTNNPSAILAPNHGTDALSTHDAVVGNLLGAASSFKGPETKACVVAGGDKLAAVGGKGQRGYG